MKAARYSELTAFTFIPICDALRIGHDGPSLFIETHVAVAGGFAHTTWTRLDVMDSSGGLCPPSRYLVKIAEVLESE